MSHIVVGMQDTEPFSETISERNQRREAEIGEAMQREAERQGTPLPSRTCIDCVHCV
jgi:hypothetical protein